MASVCILIVSFVCVLVALLNGQAGCHGDVGSPPELSRQSLVLRTHAETFALLLGKGSWIHILLMEESSVTAGLR